MAEIVGGEESGYRGGDVDEEEEEEEEVKEIGAVKEL